MPTEFAQQALDILRDHSKFQWYVISLLAVITYIYSSVVFNKCWHALYAGLALTV